MVMTSGQFPNAPGARVLVDEVELKGARYLRYTHADGRVELRRLTDEEVKHLDGLAAMKDALKQYGGPIAP